MNEARNEYIRALFDLSRRDLRAWEDFMQAFEVYVRSELEHALSTPVMEAQHALGMSRRLLDIRNDFRDIAALKQKISK